MKKLILIYIMFLFCFAIFSQEYAKIDKIVDAYPHSFTKPEKLADLISNDFKSDKDKVRAIYRWIAQNIKYDVDAFFAGQKSVTYSYSSNEEKEQKQKEYELNMAAQALKKKKAVCEGYSTLFKILCDLTKAECVVIQGHSKISYQDIGKAPKGTDHSWNAVKINNKWELVDVTWGAGYVDYAKKTFIPKYNDVYFLTPPERFFLKHFPENKDWLFINKSIQDFVDQPLYYTDFDLTDISVIKPLKGILQVKSKEKVGFRWKTSLDTKDLSYAFKGDKYGREISATSKEGLLTFEIPIEKATSGPLTFYYKGVSILAYRIELK